MNAQRPVLLVVDDEPEVLRTVYDLFRLDYKVLTADRASVALRLLVENDVRVILSDQRMPEMTGVELLAQAARLRPDTTRLLFTGYADLSAVIDAINQGNVFRYISKPWEVSDFQAVVRQAVERSQLLFERRKLIEELERKNAELVEANQLKQRFIEVASHELNTPVGVVLGLADLWKLTQGPGATAAELGWVDRIQHAGHRLAGTVERMWKLLQADRFEIVETTATELDPLIRETVSELEPFLSERHQKVELQLDPELGVAQIDAPKISDVLANLLYNAIKFTPDSGVIQVDARPDGPGHVLLSVTDPGIGIPAEDLRHLFQPFFTGHDTEHHSSGKYEYCKRGIGLGLCLVKTFVDLHGGEVSVRSEPGQGSTFEVRLPRGAPLANGEADAQPSQVQGSPASAELVPGLSTRNFSR